MSSKRKTEVSEPRSGPNLRGLKYSPDENPLWTPQEIEVKRRRVRTGGKRELMDPETGEVGGVALIYTIEDKDDEEFVKVFADGVKAAFGLSMTAARVFQVVLRQYESTPMSSGYAEAVYLAWFDGGLSGQKMTMTDRTFHTGLKELLAKGFLAPKAPNLFWVNPSLFFKGSRVAFLKEYRRKKKPDQLPPAAPEQAPKPQQIDRDPNTGDMFGG